MGILLKKQYEIWVKAYFWLINKKLEMSSKLFFTNNWSESLNSTLNGLNKILENNFNFLIYFFFKYLIRFIELRK